jgi:hypothetical protein
MKYKTLFRVLLKLVGVYFTALGLCTIAGQVLNLIGMLSYRAAVPSSQLTWYVLSFLSPALEMGVGLYLFLGGKWIADKAIPGNRPYCHECGYDLSGAVGSVCNECGTPFRRGSEVAANP